MPQKYAICRIQVNKRTPIGNRGSAGTAFAFFFIAVRCMLFADSGGTLALAPGVFLKRYVPPGKVALPIVVMPKRNGNFTVHLKKITYEQRERSEVEGTKVNP
jgi:hypothetical protein